MIMDSSCHIHQQTMNPIALPQRADLKLTTTTPPKVMSPVANNNNNETPISPTITTNSKAGLKRSFDVAFLMMPDERIKQKQAAEKQARLAENHFPTDLSPRQLLTHQQHLQQLHDQAEIFQLQEARRYSQISIGTTPRIYDDPSVIIPDSPEPSPLPPIKSAFTKVINTRLESPIPPGPPLSPDQLSCSSLSPPIATTPPRTSSGNGSLSNGSTGNSTVPSQSPSAVQLNPNIVYQNFRPEYNFNGAFHSVNQVQALQAAAAQNQRIKQQLLYRAPMHTPVHGSSANGGPSPPDFFPGYPGFPFPPSAAQHFATVVAPPEMQRIPMQNPAAAAILSTLIPPTLASTFTLTAQNVCAKCNISFRMTSDLVYHMRSHHKSEVACDPNRRKREEKLKCPVCNESFRERHHLTRHMTAHQDKESDSATTTTANSVNGNDPCLNSGGAGSRHLSRNAAISK